MIKRICTWDNISLVVFALTGIAIVAFLTNHIKIGSSLMIIFCLWFGVNIIKERNRWNNVLTGRIAKFNGGVMYVMLLCVISLVVHYVHNLF